MGSGRTLGLLGTAAVLVCLAGSLRAAVSDGFIVRTRVAHPPARMALSVARDGEWNVTVGFDAERCEVYCAFRLKADEFGRHRLTGLLLPPIAAIRIYWDSNAEPEMLIVDPAGLGQPGLARSAVTSVESVYLPGRRLAAASPAPSGDPAVPAVSPDRFVPSTLLAPVAVPSLLPLRI